MENKLVMVPDWKQTLNNLKANDEIEHTITSHTEVNKIRVHCTRIKEKTGRNFTTSTFGSTVIIKRTA